MKIQRKTLLALALVASAPAAWSNPVLDAELNYVMLGAGIGLNSSDLSHQIRLSSGTPAITLAGVTSMDRGRGYNLTLGRQWHDDPTTQDPDPRRWRFEAQWWTMNLPRQRFQTGQLNVGLQDDVGISGLYAQAHTRLWRGETTQWWVGAGLGYARVSMPDASSTSPGCGCLGAASGNGASWRLMTTLERSLSESSSVYGTIVHTRVPSAKSNSSSAPFVDTTIPGILELGVGLRITF